MDLPFEVVHQFKVEPVKAELFGIKTTRNWKRYAKECKTQKKAQAKQEHLQRWQRIRESDYASIEIEAHGVWSFGTETMSQLVISVSDSEV